MFWFEKQTLIRQTTNDGLFESIFVYIWFEDTDFSVYLGVTTTEGVVEDMVATRTDETVAMVAVEGRGRIVEGLGKNSENLLQVHNRANSDDIS